VRIVIQSTYRGHVINRTLEPGEHEVPQSVGEYLINLFSGPPFFAREVGLVIPAETKLVRPGETKRKKAKP